MKKRLLSLLLTICLVAGLVPTVVIAADGRQGHYVGDKRYQ